MSTEQLATVEETQPTAASPLKPQADGKRPRPNRVAVVFAFLATYLIWGSTYLAIRYAIETIPPLFTAAMRHLFAGLILLGWCLAKRLRPTREQLRASFVIAVFFFLIAHGLLHWAEVRVPSGLTSLLIATEPIFVFVLTALAARQWRWNATLLTGVLLGLAGVMILMARTSLTSSAGMLVSSLAILISALSWSAGIVYSRRSKLSGHPLLLSALSLLWGFALLSCAGTIVGEWRGFSFRGISRSSWLALAYLSVFGSLVAYAAYNWLLEYFSPTLVAAHTYVNPVVAVLLGWLFAKEAVTWNVAISAVMVIVAVFLVDLGTTRLARRA
ncbi:MAG: drug/metabolite exporter YedA [Candidatus Acidiferrum sp.]